MYNNLVAFLYGWSLLIVIQTATIAAVCIAVGKFMGILFPTISSEIFLINLSFFKLSTQQIFALLICIILTYINSKGIKYGVITQILMLIINLSLCGIYKSYVFPISLLICHAFSSCIMLLKCKEIIDLKLIFFKLIKLIVLLSIYTITVFFINQYIPNKMVIDITINLILFLIIGVMSLFILGYNIRKLILR